MNRRNFIITSGKIQFLSIFAVAGLKAGKPFAENPNVFPDETDIKTLAAACDIIYPGDKISPGAKNLGIENYLRVQLPGRYYSRFRSYLVSLISYLNNAAKLSRKELFYNTPVKFQKELISEISSGRGIGVNGETVKAFNILVNITLEGCFSDPVHGGNRDFGSWKIMEENIERVWFEYCGCD